MNDTAFFVQSQEYRYGRWSQWWICSPRYETLKEAREHYDGSKGWPGFPVRFRLVRGTTLWKRVPKMKTQLLWNSGSTIKVLAKKSCRMKQLALARERGGKS